MIQAQLFIYTETSLHAGTGSTVSVVDLPIQRERTTQYPIVQGSGVKGALRAQFNGNDAEAATIFGPETSKDAHAGAVSVGDARIVLFPVRSLGGVFAYVTSPAVLARLQRDAVGLPALTSSPAADGAFVTSGSEVVVGGSNSKVVLEEFSFTPQVQAEATGIGAWLAENALPQGAEYAYWRNKVKTSLVILPDDAFRDFVVHSTEIVTRVRLDPASKTVQTGALWTEESLPSDVLMVSSVQVFNSRSQITASAADVRKVLQEGIGGRIQLGGDETTGSGFVALKWL